MDFTLLFWVEAILAFFLGLLLLLDYKRYKEPIFKFLYIVFFIVVIKSIVYVAIDFGEVFWTKLEIGYTGATREALFDDIMPLYYLRFFVWQAVELIFIIALSYAFLIRRKSVETENLRGIKTFMWLQILLVLALVAVVAFLSLQSKEVVDLTYETDDAGRHFVIQERAREGVPAVAPRKYKFTDTYEPVLEKEIVDGRLRITRSIRTYKTDIAFVEFIKGNLGRGILVVWKLVLLVFAWVAISSIYGYVGNLLSYINKNKKLLYFFLGVIMLFYVFSSLILFNSNMGWFVIGVTAMVLFAVFGYKVHLQFIEGIEKQVENLARERDIIIDLMRNISAIIGAGDFELDTIIKEIVDASVKGSSARAGAILIRDPLTNRLTVQYVKGMYPPTRPFKIVAGMTLNEAMIVEKFRAEKIAIGEGLIGQVAESGVSIYIPDTTKDDRFIQTIKGTMTVVSFLAVPLKTKEEVFGVLTIVDDERSFLESDLGLIETLGEQAAITIQQIQMYQEILEKKQAEKELGVAGEIQRSLIPHTFPEGEKYDMYAFSIPAKGVGGDYYDYIDFGSNKIAVMMFDVSGKGVPAALIMVMIRSILRTIATLEEETNDVLHRLNNTISEEIVEDRYATGFYLLFDAERGIMSYTNAGHGPLVLYRASKDEFEYMDTDGMPVGIMADIEYGKGYTTLERGDIAVLYTDGITEAMNEAHEEFGMDRFFDVIRSNKREPAREIANRILEEVNRFVGTAPQHDDETLLIFKMR
jgi:sigma-B regulation protein RsbU (phosphoserine phosphatase)